MRIRQWAAFWTATCVLMASVPPARAALLIDIDKSSQRMIVALDGAELFAWPVSTGAAGYDTPSGEFKPFRMEKDHFSREWDDAPMPNSIFFTQKGHAIHGSYHKSIGQPASHGCVRLAPKNAATLFGLVRQEGMNNTRVVLHGQTPGASEAPAVARRDNSRDYRRSFSTDDADIVATIPRPPREVRGWRDFNDGRRTYYYREPYYREQPSYPPPPRYGYGAPAPFPFGR